MKKIVLLTLLSLMITVSVSLSAIPPNYMNTTSPNPTIEYSTNSVTSTSSLKTNTTQAIYSNSGFTGVNSPWTGSGTKTSPYVLDGYNISTSSSAYTIDIEGTTAYFVIKNCYFSANSTGQYGIYLYNVTNGLIENNTINYSFIGIGVSISSNITIMKNIVTNSADWGINLNTNNLMTIYNNTITGSKYTGFYSLMGSNSTVTYNNISYNDWSGSTTDYGITDDGSGVNMTYSHNIVNYNGQDGIWVHSYSDDIVTYNTVEFNQGNGIYFGSSVTTPGLMNVSYNYIAHNTQDGINIHLAVGNSVTNNIIINNGGNGVNVGYQNYNNYFADNNVSNNGQNGFLVAGSSSNVTVKGNIINSNSNGLYLMPLNNTFASNSTFENNTISYSVNYGFYINSSNNNIFINNYVDKSQNNYGVSDFNSTNNTFYLNSFVNNYPVYGSAPKVHTLSSIGTNSLATTYNTQAAETNKTNHWTNGYYGNYYSDYSGTDANKDGIGNTNYTLAGSGINDTLPLMFPNVFSLKPATPLSPFNQGTQGHIIKWNVTGYENILFQTNDNNNLGSIVPWMVNGSSEISYIADTLLLGTHTINLIVTNVNMSLQLQSSTTVTVFDTTAPTLSVSSTSITYVYGTTGHTLSINATDYNPSSYIVYENGSKIASGLWTNNVDITISVDKLNVGTYNFTAVVFDKSSNQAQVTVMITVTPAPQTTTSLTISTTVPNTSTSSTSSSKHSTPGFETIVSLLSLGITGTVYLTRKRRNY